MTRRVLLIEDDETSTFVIREIINQGLPSVQLTCAATMTEGLEELEIGDYDLLILDMLLPDGSGLEVIAHVNASNRIPIVVLSACDHDELIHQARMLDIDAYLVKPVIADELITLLRALLIVINKE